MKYSHSRAHPVRAAGVACAAPGPARRSPPPADRCAAAPRRAAFGAALLVMLCASLCCTAPASAADPVRIFFDVFENPPLICGNSTVVDPVRPGQTIMLLRMASERAGVPITLSRAPWQRGLYLIETGQADAIFASSYVEDRLRYGVYPLRNGVLDTSRKLFDQSYRLFVRAGSGIGWDGHALTNLRAPVGATTGYAVVPVLRAMGVTVEEEPNHLANLRKLAAGRLDAYAELDTHIRPLLPTNPLEFGSIVELSPPVLTKPYFLMFSKLSYARAPQDAERIWDAIAQVNNAAAYQDLLQDNKCAD